MPPNISPGPISILDQSECRYKQAANPYTETKNACFEECSETSASAFTRENDEIEQLAENTVRVATRARLTYELYKYSKNAMLVVDNSADTMFISDDYSITDRRSNDLKELRTTFKKFRFEVEFVGANVHNKQEIYDKVAQFFQRDFTDYGAVALVILTDFDRRVYPSVRPKRSRTFDESIIIDNFKQEKNSTLVDKPKIYITELCDSMDGLDRATHGDVIGFHSSANDSVVARVRTHLDLSSKEGYQFDGPLRLFCKKLAAMGDSVSLTEIVAQTVAESTEHFSLLHEIHPEHVPTPMGMMNTLNKELYFERDEEDYVTAL